MDVHCQTSAESWLDADGYAGHVAYGADGVPGNRAVLDRAPCGDLRDWLGADGEDATTAQVVAVHVLAHEAMHVAGETDEAVAECRAVQRDAELARRLGASPEDARELARRYYREVYPHLREGYVDGGCAPGGVLDERRDTPPW
jgi:hypothetical protein